jgi:hypothetical protein
MNKPQRGGVRPNSGRPVTDLKIPLNVRISQQAADLLNQATTKKSEYIDNLIKERLGQ